MSNDDLEIYRGALIRLRGGDPTEIAAKYIAERNLNEFDVPKFIMLIKNSMVYGRLDESDKRLRRELIRQLWEYEKNVH